MLEIIGFYENYIYFKKEHDESIVRIKKNLPREDLILMLKISPDDCKAFKDSALIEASKKPLTLDQKIAIWGKE